MPKTWCRKLLSGSGDAISALKTGPCFTLLSVPLPSISFGGIIERARREVEVFGEAERTGTAAI